MMTKTILSQTRDALAYHLAALGFTHFITLNFGLRSDVVPPEVEDEKVSITDRFLYRLAHRVMRRCDDRLEYVGTFERFTNGRNPVPFHAHILLKVPFEREKLLHKHAHAIFRQLEPARKATCDIKIIIDPLDVSVILLSNSIAVKPYLQIKPVLASDAEPI